MPTPVTFSNLEQLIERIAIHMTANGAGENTGERTQQLLMEMVLGVLAIVGDAPDGIGSIQPWDAGLEYTDQVLVSHNGFLWLFAGGAANTGTQPGTDEDVWLSMGAPVVTAASLEEVLAVGHTTGANNIEVASGQRIDFRGPESEGTLSLKPISVTDDNTIYLPDRYGTIALLEDLDAQDLHAVLVNGSETNGRSITVSEFDGVNFEQGANMARVKAPASLTALRTLLLPDKDGTLATTAEVDAVAALIDGTLKAPEAFAPSGSYPTTFAGVAVSRGDTFRLSAGTMGARTVDSEDLAVALVDTPGQTDGNWQVIESNRVVATQAQAEDSASTNTALLVPPQRWWQAWAKGLTLSGFFSAVRGVVLTGYTAGANTAIAATDSILAAFGKVQGQVNAINTAVAGKLAKASNLSDLSSAASARANLGLGRLATNDYAQAIVDEAPIQQAAHGLVIGDLVRYDGSAWVKSAYGGDAAARVMAMVVEVPNGGSFRLLRRGLWNDNVFGLVMPGAQYYLDPTTPGAWTKVRPVGRVVPVFVGMPLNSIDFTPTATEASSGGLITDGLSTSVTVGDGGVEVADLSFEGAAGAVYRVHVEAWVQTDSVGECVSLAIIPTSGTVIGRLFKQTKASGDCVVQAFRNSGALNAEGTAIEELIDLAYIIEAEVTCSAGPVNLFLASSSSSAVAKIQKDSHLRWERLN